MERFFEDLKDKVEHSDFVFFDTNFFQPPRLFISSDPLSSLSPKEGIIPFIHSLAIQDRSDDLKTLFDLLNTYSVNLQEFLQEEKTRVTSGVLREHQNMIRYYEKCLSRDSKFNREKSSWQMERTGLKSVIDVHKALQRVLRERCEGNSHVILPGCIYVNIDGFEGDNVDRELIGTMITIAREGYRVVGFSFDGHIYYGINMFSNYGRRRNGGNVEVYGIEKSTGGLKICATC